MHPAPPPCQVGCIARRYGRGFRRSAEQQIARQSEFRTAQTLTAPRNLFDSYKRFEVSGLRKAKRILQLFRCWLDFCSVWVFCIAKEPLKSFLP